MEEMKFVFTGSGTVRIFQQVTDASWKKNVSIKVQNEGPNAVKLVAGSSFNLDVMPYSSARAQGDHAYFELQAIDSKPTNGSWMIEVI
jgi:hypothetical protein